MEELVELPGVGRKTASVVLCQAFGIPAFPVDTHIHRLAQRWGLSSGRSVEETERDLRRHFREESWTKLHLQIIYFGREHCPALRHDPAGCPICSFAAKRGSAKRTGAAKRGTACAARPFDGLYLEEDAQVPPGRLSPCAVFAGGTGPGGALRSPGP